MIMMIAGPSLISLATLFKLTLAAWPGPTQSLSRLSAMKLDAAGASFGLRVGIGHDGRSTGRIKLASDSE
jgi:hypothetical protein